MPQRADLKDVEHVHEAFFHTLPKDCQVRRLLLTLRQRALAEAQRQALDDFAFTELMGAAIDVLTGIQSAMNPLANHHLTSTRELTEQHRQEIGARLWEHERKIDPNGVIWGHRELRSSMNSKADNRDFWPYIDLAQLESACHEYLEHGWMQCRDLDWLFVDGFMYVEAFEFGKRIFPKLYGDRSLDWIVNKIDKGKMESRSARWELMGAILTLGISGFVGFGAWRDHGLWAGILAFMAAGAITTMSSSSAQRGDEQSRQQLLDLWSTMCALYGTVSQRPMSPSYLREILMQSTAKGISWPVAIFPVIEKAISRNPALWE